MLDGSPITEELIKISHSKQGLIKYAYSALIHIVEKDLAYQPIKVLGIDIERDYEHNLADVINCELAVSPGTWSDYIMPFVENLEISIIAEPVNFRAPVSVTRYKAYCKTLVNFRKTDARLQNVNTETIDRMDIVKVEFQLVPLLMEKLLPLQIGTNVVNSNVTDALTSLLMGEATKLQGLDNADMLKGVDMVKADNETVYDNIPIPHGIKLLDLPLFLQKKLYGVYKQGMGHYIQTGMWYIYPKSRTKRNDDKTRFINIFISPKDFLKYTENTWTKEGNDLYIIAALEGDSKDISTSANTLNKGNGIRVLNPDLQTTDESVKVAGNKAIISRANNVSEVILNESKNGVVNAPFIVNQKDTNIYEQVSQVEARDGKLIGLVWHNSQADLVKPGSVVRVHYTDANVNQQVMLEGIVIKAHHYIHATSASVVSTQYSSVSALFVFVRK
jgi:hypothetical protein|nr:MAG TPA: hypothetical protein [Caudoviricetes sp.]